MSVMACEHTIHCWCSPPPLWAADQERWDLFRLSINARIRRAQWQDGRDDIGTFDPPIPANVAARALPTGRVAPFDNTRQRRGDGGRFVARERGS
jgi:hypothetical protein